MTSRTDYTADLLITRLRERNVDFVRFNTEDFPFSASSSLMNGSDSITLRKAGTRVDFANVQSVWYRRPADPAFPEEFDDGTSNFVIRESREFLQGIWRCLDCLWVNHPDKIRLAENKVEQLNRMRHLGFRIPRTVITNDPDIAAKFYESNSGSIIAKTLRASHGRLENSEYVIYTSSIDAEHLSILETVRYSPVLFQERIPKVSDIRVTVVGPEIFATEIHSQEAESTKIDWRRDTLKLRHTIHELPEQIKEQCLKLVEGYGLVFGAIDLIKTVSEYVFLELNPNGQWAWIESLTGQPISNKLIDALISRDDLG